MGQLYTVRAKNTLDPKTGHLLRTGDRCEFEDDVAERLLAKGVIRPVEEGEALTVEAVTEPAPETGTDFASMSDEELRGLADVWGGIDPIPDDRAELIAELQRRQAEMGSTEEGEDDEGEG